MAELNGQLEVKGFETASGGKFDNITMAGLGKIKGNVMAKTIEVNGTGDIAGEIVSETLKIAGTLTAEKEVKLNSTLNVNGEGSFSKDVSCSNILVAGKILVKGDIKCTNINISGIANLKGIVTANEMDIVGSLDGSSDLRINNVIIDFGEKSSCNDILADEVNIQTTSGKKGLFSMLKKNIFKCNEIRAKKIFVENTECKLIIGDEIVIGENCKVERVEYTEKFEFAKTSEVKETLCKK